jgi:pimeloyl-ACP methyl ester carboxylesterase
MSDHPSDRSDDPLGVRNGKLFVNGVNLHFATAGSGPPILLVHGWLGSSHHWRKLMPLLAGRHTVLALDVRGYGESDKPYSGYDGRTIAADILGLSGQLGLERPIVVGHDMGALPALLLAAEHPEVVSGLVYVDEPLPGYNLDRFTAFSEENPFVYWWFAFNAQPHLPAALWAGREAELVDYFLTAMSADPTAVSEADKAEYVRGLRKPGGLHGSFGWYREVLTTARQIREATRTKISTPVLAINGQYGHPEVLEQMQLVAEVVEGVTLANCGHLCAEEKPEEMAGAILAFAERVQAG